ncbi:RNA recognition motif-containing protein [Microdochium nivale]|nr:RNA recognition motif-containing protein [Microdochium nivale]
MSSSTTVNVSNVSSETDDKQIREFFSFCGKITDISVTPGSDGKTKSATVTFEKETAAKTATLLNNTQLQGSQISVVPADGHHDDGGNVPHVRADEKGAHSDDSSDDISQEDKPRSRVLAEYMAGGYVIGDAALQRAIELDHQHGVSNRFMNTLNSLDQKYHATDRAKAADQSYGVSSRATNLFWGLNSYFEKAANTPSGKKLVNFYTQSSRQVQDVHAEARRLADLKKEQHGGDAIKASGLEKVFGKAKETDASASGTPASDTPAPGPKAGTTESTPIASTGNIPSKAPGDEKN